MNNKLVFGYEYEEYASHETIMQFCKKTLRTKKTPKSLLVEIKQTKEIQFKPCDKCERVVCVCDVPK